MTSLPLQGILFDLDDTLIDWSHFNGDWITFEREHMKRVYDFVQSEGYLQGLTFKRVLNDYTSRVKDAWASARSTMRAPHLGRILMQTLHTLGLPDNSLTEDQCLAVYGWDALEGVRVFPDVPPMLQSLIDKGIKIGIVTNAFQPMRLRDKELQTHGLLDYFPDCRISAADVGYLKPHPQIFAQALKEIATQPDRTVFIGDSPSADIAGAQAANMKAVLRVKHPAPPLISGLIVPDAAINSMEELPSVLTRWYSGWDH